MHLLPFTSFISWMQLTNLKISNVSSFPYQSDLSKIEGVKFYNAENNNVNVLIWPNGAGKSWFLHILKQIIKVGIMNDYLYDKKPILIWKKDDLQKVIQHNEQFSEWIRKHFAFPDKPSEAIIQFTLTEHDYDNLTYIAEHTALINTLLKKYSTLDFQYPVFSKEQIHALPKIFTLRCLFDTDTKKVIIDDAYFSSQNQFILLYLKTIELIEICFDIYNVFERE